MADQGATVLTAYELSDMDVVFPNDETAVLSYRVKHARGTARQGRRLRCRR